MAHAASIYGLAIAIPVAVWWAATLLVFMLVGMKRSTRGYSLLGTTALGFVALGFLGLVRDDNSFMGAVGAFVAALLVWGWLEATYLLGAVTGPRAQACPEGCSVWERFRYGVLASLYHELSVIAAGFVLIVMHWDATNDIGLWAFLVLWAMRWSAKLNLFLGVPRFNDAFLPEHLRYLTTFMVQRPLNALFPFSVLFGTLAAVAFAWSAWTAAGDFGVVRGSLVASLIALGLLEHWLMVLPIDDSFLWSLARRRSRRWPRRALPVPAGR